MFLALMQKAAGCLIKMMLLFPEQKIVSSVLMKVEEFVNERSRKFF